MNPRISLFLIILLAIGASPSLFSQAKSEDASKRTGKKQPVADTQRTNQAPKQITRHYHIPATFLVSREDVGKTEVDPFAEKKLEAGSGEFYTLRMIFLKAGVELNTTDSLAYDHAAKVLTVTTSAEAHRQLENYFTVLEDEAEKQIHVLVEYIEVNHLDFSDWLFENRISGDGTPLRKEVQEWARNGEATILESVMVTARSGQRAKVESITEQIYPTEYDPPEIPGTLTQGLSDELPVTGVTATAFETRNLGVTLEVDPVLGVDDVTIDLNLAPELVQLEGHTTWANEEVDENFQIKMPTFYTMKTTTQVTLLDGQYAFLSTLRPLKASDEERSDALVLVFVRADVGSLGRWSVEDSR